MGIVPAEGWARSSGTLTVPHCAPGPAVGPHGPNTGTGAAGGAVADGLIRARAGGVVVVVLDGTVVVVVLDGTVVVLLGVMVLDGTVVELDGTVVVLDGVLVVEACGRELGEDELVDGSDLGAAPTSFTEAAERTGTISATASTGATARQVRRRSTLPWREDSCIRVNSFAMCSARAQ